MRRVERAVLTVYYQVTCKLQRFFSVVAAAAVVLYRIHYYILSHSSLDKIQVAHKL